MKPHACHGIVPLIVSASASLGWVGETPVSTGLSGGAGQPAMVFDGLNRLHVVFSSNPNHLY